MEWDDEGIWLDTPCTQQGSEFEYGYVCLVLGVLRGRRCLPVGDHVIMTMMFSGEVAGLLSFHLPQRIFLHK